MADWVGICLGVSVGSFIASVIALMGNHALLVRLRRERKIAHIERVNDMMLRGRIRVLRGGRN